MIASGDTNYVSREIMATYSDNNRAVASVLLKLPAQPAPAEGKGTMAEPDAGTQLSSHRTAGLPGTPTLSDYRTSNLTTLRTEATMLHHHDVISRAVSTDREITLEALRVFTYLSRRLHFDRSVPVLQSELADALGMQRPNVNRAIKLLETKQILLRESKLGRAITFRLNPGLEGGRA